MVPKLKSPGNVMNCPENQTKFKPPPHPAVGCFRAHNFKSRGISSTAEKIDTLLIKPSLHSPGRGSFREHDFKVTKFKNVSRECNYPERLHYKYRG